MELVKLTLIPIVDGYRVDLLKDAPETAGARIRVLPTILPTDECNRANQVSKSVDGWFAAK